MCIGVGAMCACTYVCATVFSVHVGVAVRSECASELGDCLLMDAGDKYMSKCEAVSAAYLRRHIGKRVYRCKS